LPKKLLIGIDGKFIALAETVSIQKVRNHGNNS